jgi:hypothetical protein
MEILYKRERKTERKKGRRNKESKKERERGGMEERERERQGVDEDMGNMQPTTKTTSFPRDDL